MGIETFIDLRIPLGSATNQLLVYNDSTGLFDYKTTLSGLTLVSPVISGDFSWTGNSTWDCSDATDKIVAINPSGGFAFKKDNDVWLELETDDNKIEFGNTTDNPNYLFLGSGLFSVGGNILLTDGGDIGVTGDADLLTLANALLTVNGDVDITDDLEVAGHIGVGGQAPSATIGIYHQETFDVTAFGMVLNPSLNAGVASDASVTGASFSCTLNGTVGDNDQKLALGLDMIVQTFGAYTGTLDELVGMRTTLKLNLASSGDHADITDIIGVDILNSFSLWNDIGNLYGVKIAAAAVPIQGSLDAAYGIYIGDQSPATAGWSIYSLGGNMAHVGNVRLGSNTAPTAQLHTDKGRISEPNRYTANQLLDSDDHIVFCNGSLTISLPAGVEGTNYVIKNTGTGVVSVDPNGTEELYGSGAGVASTLSPGENIDIHYNATDGWY